MCVWEGGYVQVWGKRVPWWAHAEASLPQGVNRVVKRGGGEASHEYVEEVWGVGREWGEGRSRKGRASEEQKSEEGASSPF